MWSLCCTVLSFMLIKLVMVNFCFGCPLYHCRDLKLTRINCVWSGLKCSKCTIRWINKKQPCFLLIQNFLIVDEVIKIQMQHADVIDNVNPFTSLGCRDGTVVRALASHQCGLGSIPTSSVICGLKLLVLYSAPLGLLRLLRFPLSLKNQHLTWFALIVNFSSQCPN